MRPSRQDVQEQLASRLERETGSELNISPLIDMIFILLIFFMVSTNFVKDMKIDIERPGVL